MKLAALALLVSLMVSSPATGQSCSEKPDPGQFHMSGPKWADPSQPTLPNRTVQFALVKNTTCYPWYVPCPGYAIQACDTIAWSFGDGATATTTGDPTMSHRFAAPGLYAVEAKVTNPKGSAVVSTAVLVAAEPLAYITFSESMYSVAETAGSVVFEPGERTKSFSIPVIDDKVYNGNSQHAIWIVCETGAALLPRGMDGYGHIRIVENEPAPTATAVGTVRVDEGDGGPTLLKIPVILSQTFSQNVDLWWTIWEETARREVDWSPPPPHGLMSGGLTIPAGQTTGELSVLILGDTTPESDETFRMEFFRSGAVAVVAVGSPVKVTIVDDDIAFSSEAPLIPAGQTHQLRLRTAAMPGATSALLESTDPSIAEVPQSISIPAGATSTSFAVKAGQPGTADVRATLSGTKLTTFARVTVYLPLVPSFERGSIEVGEQRSTSLALHIDPPPDVPATATLKSTPASLIQIPSTIIVPTGGKASLRIEGRSAGNTVVTATLAQSPGQPSAALSVTVVERDRPTLASVEPAVGPTAGGTSVTIRGENFAPTCGVLFGDLFATVSSRDASTIVAVAPPHATGTVDVSLVCGSRTALLSNAFEYVAGRRRAVR